MTISLPVSHSEGLQDAGFRHGFFACGPAPGLHAQARGGISHGQVASSRGRMIRHLAVVPEDLHCARQVHGDQILEIVKTGQRRHWERTEGDALITCQKGLAVGVVTADCAPLLVADPSTGWVAAAHLGRLGALAGLAAALVNRLLERGACLDTLRFAVGPHIQAESYEVGEAMFSTLPSAAQHRDRSGRACCSLRGLIAADLEAVGVQPEQIGWSAIDTLGDAEYFSHRRQGDAAGRQLSAIVAGAPRG